MKRTIVVQLMGLFLISVFIISCTPGQSAKETPLNYGSFIQELGNNKEHYEFVKQESGDLLGAEPKLIKINGKEVRIYEYANNSEMEKNAARISTDGSSIGDAMIKWVGPPHFFKKGKIIVFYAGNDKNTVASIEKITGKQFAGMEAAQPTNFAECAASGNPIMESYPRQCSSNGNTFIEEAKKSNWIEKTIKTEKADLELSYKDGTATLIGNVMRPTPCVEYDLQTIMTKDYPSSNVGISINRKVQPKGMMCIQVLGKPFEINETINPVSENTNYKITLDNITIFKGKIEEGE